MIRSIFSLIILALITIVFTLCVVLTGLITRSKRSAYRYIRAWAWSLLQIFRVQVRVKGGDKIDFDAPVIYMSNHLSQGDIPILMWAIPSGLSFIAKNSLANIPFLSWSMKMVGMVFISRSDTRGAIDVLNQAALKIPKEMNFMVFPEGTRSHKGGRVLNRIKKGGFHLAKASGRAIQPVAVVGSEHILPRGGMAIRPGTVEVRFGRPIEVDDSCTVGELVSRYQKEMENLLVHPMADVVVPQSSGLLKQRW